MLTPGQFRFFAVVGVAMVLSVAAVLAVTVQESAARVSAASADCATAPLDVAEP